MLYTLEVQRLLLQLEEVSKPQDKVKLLLECIYIVDKNKDIDWGFDLRIRLINEEIFTASSKHSVIAFSWILDAAELGGGSFLVEDYLYEYKWMFASCFGSTQISKEQFHAIGDDFHEHLLSNGYSSRGYYHILAIWFQHLRDFERAEQIIALMLESSIDDFSDNKAYELTLQTYNALKMGQIDKALSFAAPLFRNEFEGIETCFDTYSVFSYEFFLMDDERGLEFFRLAEKHQKQYAPLDYITDIRSRVLFLFLQDQFTSDPDWEFFEGMCNWEKDAEDFYSYYFIKYSLLMLQRNLGYKEFTFLASLDYYKPSGIYYMPDLFATFKQRAYDYAEKFDNRNGSDYFTLELNDLLK